MGAAHGGSGVADENRWIRTSGAILVAPSGVAQLAEQLTVNQWVVGSSPTPGAQEGLLREVFAAFRALAGDAAKPRRSTPEPAPGGTRVAAGL